MSDFTFTRYSVPNGGGVADHPFGLLYRRKDVDPVVIALRTRIRELEAEKKALVGALEDIAEGEPDPDNLAEMIWCKDRAAECLTTIRASRRGAIRARSNKDKTNE